MKYDAADNLTDFPAGPKQAFNAGNQLCYQATTNTAACGAAPTDATLFSYDTRGNRVSTATPAQPVRAMAYDQANRLVTATEPVAATDNNGELTTVDAALLFDTRPASRFGTCTPNCVTFSAGQVKTVQVTGVGPVPVSGVGAVVLNVTSILGSTAGWVRVNRTPGSDAAAGLVHIDPGQPNNVVVVAKVDTQGRITVESDQAVDVVITVSGWYATSNGTSGSAFTALAPARIVDTRPATNTGTCTPGPCARLTAGSTVTMKVTGVGGVPTTGVSAVSISVLASGPAATGIVRVNQTGTRGDATINIDGTLSNAGTAIADVATDGTVSIYVSTTTDIVIDVSGWFGANAAAEFVSVPPARVLDTATGTGVCTPSPCAAVPVGVSTSFQVTGQAGYPTSGMSAVVLNVTATATSTATGILRVNWNSLTNSSVTMFNTNSGSLIDSAVVIAIPDTNGRISLYGTGSGYNVTVDTVGYFKLPQTTYTYTGDGLRRTKTNGDGTVTTYTWDHTQAVPALLAEAIDAPGTGNDRTIRYLYGPDGNVIEDVTTIGTVDTPRWYHHDQLGSTRLLTNTTGTTIGTAGYTPHGTTTTVTGGTTNIGWAGQYRDTETGYIYLRARYYDPATAQFLTRDPLEAITRSAYGYAANDPINIVDPSGQIGLSKWWKDHGSTTLKVGAVVLGAAAVVATGGAALTVVAGGSTFMGMSVATAATVGTGLGYASTLASAGATAMDCSRARDDNCAAGIELTALSLIPTIGGAFTAARPTLQTTFAASGLVLDAFGLVDYEADGDDC